MAFVRHSKEESKEIIRQLVDSFNKNLKYYKSEDYLEANVRAEFIDKFLNALNWDVNNENGIAPKYREVIFEVRANDEEGVVKHPDYALCMGGNPIIYVEAKPPSVKVMNADKYAIQLRKYAYSTKKDISILTDFEEFAVYDTRKKVKDDDTADKARIKYITFDHYIDEFDYLWDTFSYDAVIKGSIDTFFDKDDGNYFVNDIDREILDAIEEWRQLMIKSYQVKSGKITEENINMAVQKLINRIIFIWRKMGY